MMGPQGDFMLAEPVVLVNQGKSSVHLTGYQTTTDVTDQMVMSDDEELGNGLTASQVICIISLRSHNEASAFIPKSINRFIFDPAITTLHLLSKDLTASFYF